MVDYIYTYTAAKLQEHHDTVESKLPVKNRLKGNQNLNVDGANGSITTTPQNFSTVNDEISANMFVGSAITGISRSAAGIISATSGSYYREYDGEFPDDFYGVKLADDTIVQTGCTLSIVSGRTRITVDMATAPAHKFAGISESVGVWPDIGDEDSANSLGPLGVKQDWLDKTSVRTLGVPEANNTGRTIFVSVDMIAVGAGTNGFEFRINGSAISIPNEVDINMQSGLPVPPNATYEIVVTNGTMSLGRWSELTNRQD